MVHQLSLETNKENPSRETGNRVCRSTMMKIGILFLLLKSSISISYSQGVEDQEDLEKMCVVCECACELLEARQGNAFLKKMKAEVDAGMVNDDWMRRMDEYEAYLAKAPERKAYREIVRQNRTKYSPTSASSDIESVGTSQEDEMFEPPQIDSNHSVSTDAYGAISGVDCNMKNAQGISWSISPTLASLIAGKGG